MMIHLYKEGRELGPYTLEEVRARLRSGAVSESDAAAADGGPQMPLAALLATIPTEESSPSAPVTSRPATRPQQPVERSPGVVPATAARRQLYGTGDSGRNWPWVVFGVAAILALLGGGIYLGKNGSGAGAEEDAGATARPAAATEQAAHSDNEGMRLVNLYVRKIDGNALGLIHVEEVKKGQSYVSHGEHGIRVGVVVEPTMVTFTGWGFERRTSALRHFGVVSAWWCFKDDYGNPVAIPDNHEAGPISGDTPSEKRIPALGAVGMTAEGMAKLCGPAVRSSTPKPEDDGVQRATWRKGDFDMNCLLLDGKVYSITYSRADQQKASNTNKLVWLLQNGAHWSGPYSYTCLDNGMVAKTYTVGGGNTASYDCLEVTDSKVLTDHPAQASTLAPAPLDKIHMPHPPYPAAARASRVQGQGVCHVVFGVTGRVTSATMKQSTGSDLLDSNSIAFIKANWTGTPSTTKDVRLDYNLR